MDIYHERLRKQRKFKMEAEYDLPKKYDKYRE
jgi:hypothetical protein